jgi:hypothetical protein
MPVATATRAIILSLIAGLYSFVAGSFPVRAEEKTDWKIGAALEKALGSPVSFTWQERPLLQGLQSLAKNAEVAIFLDRRVDPDLRIDLSVKEVSLSDALDEIAEGHDLSIRRVGNVVYIAPRAAAFHAQAISAMRRRELADQPRWLAEHAAGWNDLSEPREIASAIVASADGRLSNAEAIPHDLWAGWSGPKMKVADQLTLVLLGFDLTFEVRGSEVTIVPVPKSLRYADTYRIVDPKVAAELKRKFPDIEIKVLGRNQLEVTASPQDHAGVREIVTGKKPPNKIVAKGEKVYTLTVENQPLGAIIKTMAGEIGVEVKADASLVPKLKERTSVKVTKVTANELLKQVLEPVGIKFKLGEKTLELTE